MEQEIFFVPERTSAGFAGAEASTAVRANSSLKAMACQDPIGEVRPCRTEVEQSGHRSTEPLWMEMSTVRPLWMCWGPPLAAEGI